MSSSELFEIHCSTSTEYSTPTNFFYLRFAKNHSYYFGQHHPVNTTLCLLLLLFYFSIRNLLPYNINLQDPNTQESHSSRIDHSRKSRQRPEHSRKSQTKTNTLKTIYDQDFQTSTLSISTKFYQPIKRLISSEDHTRKDCDVIFRSH